MFPCVPRGSLQQHYHSTTTIPCPGRLAYAMRTSPAALLALPMHRHPQAGPLRHALIGGTRGRRQLPLLGRERTGRADIFAAAIVALSFQPCQVHIPVRRSAIWISKCNYTQHNLQRSLVPTARTRMSRLTATRRCSAVFLHPYCRPWEHMPCPAACPSCVASLPCAHEPCCRADRRRQPALRALSTPCCFPIGQRPSLHTPCLWVPSAKTA